MIVLSSNTLPESNWTSEPVMVLQAHWTELSANLLSIQIKFVIGWNFCLGGYPAGRLLYESMIIDHEQVLGFSISMNFRY